MDKICGIYKITSSHGKVYIGESKDVFFRWSDYKKLRCKNQHRLYNSLKKYGYESHTFELIMECAFEDLKYFESCFQEIYRVVEEGLNCKYTGRDEIKGRMSQESIEKNRQSQLNLYKKGYVNPNKGKTLSVEQIEKNRQAQLKRFKNPEAIERNKKVVKIAMNCPNVRKKLSKSQKELYNNGYINPNSKRVIDTDNGIIYNSITEALKLSNTNYSHGHFASMLRGNKINKTHFRYI